MNDLLKSLGAQLKGADGGSRAVAALVGLAVLGAVLVAGVVSNKPHFELAFSGLTDHEVAKVNKALSDGGLRFEVSQPPGPFNVFVDRSERSEAYMAVYGAGALDKPLKGIISESGVSSVFQGSEERQQAVRKREWQEMEGILEALDFVHSARIRTSPDAQGALFRADVPPVTASVTLKVNGSHALSPEHGETVANLVSRGLGIAKRDLMISDQTGRSVYDGVEEEGGGDRGAKNLLAVKSDHDRRATAVANDLLAETLGPNKARVTVSSEWDYDQTTRNERIASKGGLLSESKNTEETPLDQPGLGGGGGGGGVGGPAGLSSNVAESEASDPIALPAGGGQPRIAKNEEQRKEYEPSVTTVQTVRTAPVLRRISVAAFFDETIEAERVAELEEAVKAAVGFDSQTRRDEFKSVRIPFATPPEVVLEEGEHAVAGEGEASEPNPLVEKLLERGVEIVTALAFVVLLLRSLKRSKPRAGEAAAGEANRAAGEEVDPELLARASIDELLKSDPEKVGEILSSWAREGGTVGTK